MKAKKIIITSLPFIISIFLFILVGGFGISKVNEVSLVIKSADKDQTILTQKLNLLQTLSEVAKSGTGPVNFALPVNNSTLAVISALKLIASTNGVMLTSIKSTSETINDLGLNEATVIFELEGTKPQIISSLRATAGIAPILVIDSISITESGEITIAQVSARSFWSPLPDVIPSVTQAINDLTESEKEILVNMVALTQPTTTGLPPVTNDVNPNPFGE